MKGVFRLLNIFLVSIHPIIFILAIISFFANFKTYLRKPMHRFLIIYSFIIIGICSVKLFKHGFLSDRYFLILTAIFCIFAADGFLIATQYIYSKMPSRYYNKLSYRKLTVVLLIIVLLIMAIKPFTSFNKVWYAQLRDISSSFNFTQRPVLISNDSDQRLAYYFDSTLYLVNLDSLTIFENSVCKQWNHQFNLPSHEFSLKAKDFYNELHSLGTDVFIIIEGCTAQEIERKFKSKGLPFNFNLVVSFKDRKKKNLLLFKLI